MLVLIVAVFYAALVTLVNVNSRYRKQVL